MTVLFFGLLGLVVRDPMPIAVGWGYGPSAILLIISFTSTNDCSDPELEASSSVMRFMDDLRGLTGDDAVFEGLLLPEKKRLNDEVDTARCMTGLLTLSTSTNVTDGCFDSLGRDGAGPPGTWKANLADGGPTEYAWSNVFCRVNAAGRYSRGAC